MGRKLKNKVVDNNLEDQLQHCTVKISLEKKETHEGTGFFVAPNLILTCAHVVKDAYESELTLTVNWLGQEENKVKIYKYTNADYPDIVLLHVNFNNDIYLGLQDTIQLKDNLYTYGYPDQKPNGDSATLEYEGSSHKPLLYKLKAGQIRTGFSGSPVLNLKTGFICAMIESTRGNNNDLGGRAIPVSVIVKEFPELNIVPSDAASNNSLQQTIKEIEELFVLAHFDQAYEKFYQLSEDYPDYKIQASMILTRFSDFQGNIISGVIPMSDQSIAKLQIASSFQMCLKQFKKEHLTR